MEFMNISQTKSEIRYIKVKNSSLTYLIEPIL